MGREYHRKGIDVALDVVEQLNENGVLAELRVCGLEGEDTAYAKFVGLFRKSVPEELEQYIALYHWAHFLIHPARFEPAGIVPGEAAAFGTPTITNDVGGLATTVEHGESGIVLPGGSPPEAYVEAIIGLVNNPKRYYDLSARTRQRYERE